MQKQQIVWVFDLGVWRMQLASKKTIQSTQQIILNGKSSYQKWCICNSPQIQDRLRQQFNLFDTICNKFQHILSKATLEKVVMIGDQLQNRYQFTQPAVFRISQGYLHSKTFSSGCKTETEVNQPIQPQEQEYEQEQEQEQQEQIDVQSLKKALGGLTHREGCLNSVSQTPLNTEKLINLFTSF